MNYTVEVRLLSKVIESKDFHSLEKTQISEDFFFNPECIEIYRYIKEIYYHPSSPGSVPSMDLVRERFPAFYPEPATDEIPVMAYELRKTKIRLELLLLAQTIQTQANSDPIAAKATLMAESAKISAMSEVGEDLSMSGAYQTLLSNYNTVSSSGGLLGIPYPWHPLNEETQGKLPGQFIVIYGRPKSMKSFIAIYMACHDYMISRRRVLFYTREMSPFLVAQRMAACIANVDYKSFKNGTLQPELKEHTFQILKELLEDEKAAGSHGDNVPGITIVSDRGGTGSGGGVSWLRSKIRDIKPHVAYVDGMYLMRDDRTNTRTIDWKAIAHISQDLKLTAQEFNIPLIGVTQANRNAQKANGTDLTELSFTDSLGQDADAVLRVSKKERIDANKVMSTELWLTAPGLREGTFSGIVLGAQPCTDFLLKRVLANLEEEDEELTHGPKKGPAAGPTYKKTLADPRIPMKPK